MQSLEHWWYYQSLVLLFKCIKGNGPDYISDLFEPRILRYNLRNSDHNLTQPSYNNRYYHNSFTYKASHLWNQLPSYIKRSTELSEYRKHLRSFNLAILRWLDTVFQGQCLPRLSVNYVTINKDLEKIMPQLYSIKMKICYDHGCYDIGVVIATKWCHYLIYLQQYFSALGTVLPKSFVGTFSFNSRLDVPDV